MEIHLPKDKVQCVHQELSSWLHRKTATKWDILSPVGLLQYATKVVRIGRTLVARMYSTAAMLNELTYFSTSYLHWDQTGCQVPSVNALQILSLWYLPCYKNCLFSWPDKLPKLLFHDPVHLHSGKWIHNSVVFHPPCHLSAICNMHVITGQHIVFNQQLTLQLQQVLKDYDEPIPSISHSRSEGRSPWTSWRQCSTYSWKSTPSMTTRWCCGQLVALPVFGFLRSSEITVPSQDT